MTHSNRLDIKIAMGENQTKVQRFILHFWHPWRTQCDACNDQLNLMSNHFTADGMRTGFNRSLHALHCVISQMKENKFLNTFLFFAHCIMHHSQVVNGSNGVESNFILPSSSNLIVSIASITTLPKVRYSRKGTLGIHLKKWECFLH